MMKRDKFWVKFKKRELKSAIFFIKIGVMWRMIKEALTNISS